MPDHAEAEELWQAYTEQGEPVTGQGLTLHDAGRGVLHGSSHIWLWRADSGELEILLQQRADDLLTWQDYFDASAAGHLSFGDSPEEAARRETREELGVSLPPEALKLLFTHRQRLDDEKSGIIENEIQWIYGVHAASHLRLIPDDTEVESTRWVSEAELRRIIAGEADIRIVPHDGQYFTELLAQLRAAALQTT